MREAASSRNLEAVGGRGWSPTALDPNHEPEPAGLKTRHNRSDTWQRK